MIKNWLVALLSIAMLGLIGCEPVVSATPTTLTPTVEPMATTQIIPWGNNVSGVTPSKVNISNLHAGATVDTWQGDLTTDTGFVYKRGDPMCFTIYNGNAESQSYSVELDNGDYGQPIGYAKWISVTTWNPIVSAKSAMNVPVRISIPQDTTDIPKQWEFRINVIANGQGNIQYAYSIRFLVSMR